MIVTTKLPALDRGVFSKPTTFDVCDVCHVWDRRNDYHLPGCSVGDRVWTARREREAEEARVEREREVARRAEARAERAVARRNAGTRTGRVTSSVEEVAR